MDEALQADSANTSPIMAGVQQIAVDRLGTQQGKSIPNRLIIVSDLLENTPAFSMYRSGPDIEAYRASSAPAEYGTDLAQASVEVWLLRRGTDFAGSDLADFWADWVQDNNGDFDRALQIQGMSP